MNSRIKPYKGVFKRVLQLLVICLIILSGVPLQEKEVSATDNIQAVNKGSFKFGSDYGFTFKYTEGVTTRQTGTGVYDQGSLRWTWNNNVTTSGVWVRYNNVGLYEGKVVDMQVSFVGVDKVNGTEQVISINEGMDISFKNLVNPSFRFDFYEHGTNTPIHCKGSITFSDVDDGQGIAITQGSGSLYYLAGNDWFYTSGGAVLSRDYALSGGYDDYAWITATYSGALTIKYYSPDRAEDAPWFGYSANAIAGYDTPTISKTVSNRTIHNSDEFYYDLAFSMPFISNEFYYSYLTVTDTLPDTWFLDTSLSRIYLTNEKGQSVNSQFSTTLSPTGVLTVTMNNSKDTSMYGHDYRIRIYANKKAGADVSVWGNSVPNRASISTNEGTNTSGVASVSFVHNIGSSVSNGTITGAENNI